MPRAGRSVSGGGRSGGLGGGSGPASRLSAAAESRRTTPVAHRPSFSWFSSMGEKSDCKSLYRSYMKSVRETREGENYYSCVRERQQLEDFCSQYKSDWSGWWKEQDDKDLCKQWSEIYDDCTKESNPEMCTSSKNVAERVCKAVQTPSPSPSSSSSSSSLSLMGYLASDGVLDYCI